MIRFWPVKLLLCFVMGVVFHLPVQLIAGNNSLKPITTDTLLAIQKNTDWRIVDCRLNDAYIGWKLDGVKQGGHIPGATDFSANWLKIDDSDALLEKALLTKGISKKKNIVLYDANNKDAQIVAHYLNGKGYSNLHYYDINNWPEEMPLRKYKNYHAIVPAVIVHEILDGKIPETFPQDKTVKIVEASWGGGKNLIRQRAYPHHLSYQH